MKKSIAIFTLLITLVFAFHKTLIFGFYESNKSYVAEKLCVNRDNADSDCEGKCFLMQEETQQQAQSIVVKILKDIKESLAESIAVADPFLACVQFFQHQKKETLPVNFNTPYWKPPTLNVVSKS